MVDWRPVKVGTEAPKIRVTHHTAFAPEPPRENRWDRSSWYTLLFITAVFYLIDAHNFYYRTGPSFDQPDMAAVAGSAVAAGNMARQVGYLAFGVYGIVAWLRVPRFRLNVGGFLALILVTYLGWAVLSLAWSLNPMLSVRRLSALCLLALGITGMLRQHSGDTIARLILFMTLSYLLIGVIAELTLGQFTPWASGYRFAGTVHPNIQGVNCATLVLAAVTLAATSKRFRPVLLAIAFGGMGFLVLTGSRTALAAGLASLFLIWMLKMKRGLAVITLLGLSWVALGNLLFVVNGLLPSPLGAFLTERADTPGAGVLTGRADLWAILIEYARERPILGYGYGAFFDPARGLDMAARIGAWAFGGPHSIYLGTLVDLGAIGLGCLLGILFGGLLRGVRLYQHSVEAHHLLFSALLVYQIFDGFADSAMISPNWAFVPALALAFLAFRPVQGRPQMGGAR